MPRPLDGNQRGIGNLFFHQLPVRQGRSGIRSSPDQKRLVFDIRKKMGQILIDRTPLTPAKILVLYVVSGVVLGGLGLYKYVVEWGGAGATVPLTGFGYLLAKGVAQAVAENGFLGAFTGGITAAAGGIAAAIFFGYLVALIFKPRPKG